MNERKLKQPVAGMGRVAVALLEMRRALAMIEHYNLCAAREEGLGGWQCDWSEAVREENKLYEAAKAGAAADESAKAPLAPKTAFDAAHGSARTLAASIAAALCTSGDGKKASRLVFRLESGDEWGGWSEAAIATQIEKILSAQNARMSEGEGGAS